MTQIHYSHFNFLESRVAANSITKFIKAYASNTQMICETKYEVSYILPDKGKGKKDVLKDLFASLEERKEELGIKSFGLQDTTLEEVFNIDLLMTQKANTKFRVLVYCVKSLEGKMLLSVLCDVVINSFNSISGLFEGY